MKRIVPVLAAVLLISSCAAQPGKDKDAADTLRLKVSSFSALPGWDGDDMADAIPALQKSCTRIIKRKPDESFSGFGTFGDWQAVCNKLSTYLLATNAEARAFFEDNFAVYEMRGDKGREGMFTGYYEPSLKGSVKKSDKYNIPLHARPDDLVTVDLGAFRPSLKGESIAGRVNDGKLMPYFTRADIGKGALASAKKEIVWVDSAVDAFFLHIQGSGRVEMEDGRVLRVGYAAQNGHVYFAIGKALVDRGALKKEDVSMQSIRAWLEANPAEAPEVMNLNASYVFFNELTGEGPLGGEGVALTPGRSMAVDRKLVPYGAPVWIDAETPAKDGARMRRLMLAQDTGGAIRGAVRGDYFWGAGDDAAHNAGIMKSKGVSWIFLPKTVVPPK